MAGANVFSSSTARYAWRSTSPGAPLAPSSHPQVERIVAHINQLHESTVRRDTRVDHLVDHPLDPLGHRTGDTEFARLRRLSGACLGILDVESAALAVLHPVDRRPAQQIRRVQVQEDADLIDVDGDLGALAVVGVVVRQSCP